jgi:hypothetical protein
LLFSPKQAKIEAEHPGGKLARERFLQEFRYAQAHYFAEQGVKL